MWNKRKLQRNGWTFKSTAVEASAAMSSRWWMLTILLICVSATATGCQQAQSGAVKPTPTVVCDAPVTRVVTDYEEFPGQSDAIISVQVLARVSGYMTRVYFKDGTQVEQDAKLFEIDPRQYKAELDRSEGNVQQIEAHRRRLEREYQRAKTLFSQRAVSQEEYDRYESDYRETEANLKLAIANRDLARLNYDWCEVRAPSAGLLSRRMVDPGNLVRADQTVLTTLVSLDPLYVYFDVHEQAMLRLKRLMQEGKLKVRAQGEKEVPVQIGLSDEDDFPHEGVVDFTDNRVDLNTGTLRFRAKIFNPPDRNGNRFIVPGLFVRVRLPIGDPHSALMVREQAMVTDQGRKTVYVLKEKKDKQGETVKNEKGQPVYIAMVRDVGNVGVLKDGFREVQRGVEPADLVVVEGMQKLRPGMEVHAEKYDDKSGSDAPTKPALAKSGAAEANPGPNAVAKTSTSGAHTDLPSPSTKPTPSDSPVPETARASNKQRPGL
jgi:multidrug efflux system membrane fusion protein